MIRAETILLSVVSALAIALAAACGGETAGARPGMSGGAGSSSPGKSVLTVKGSGVAR